MSDKRPPDNRNAANSPDYSRICVCFEDADIGQLFAELLEVQGARTFQLTDIRSLAGDVKVITEPRFFKMLEPKYQSKCLVVGNKDALKELNCLCLSRPLTEDKVEKALSDLLSLE